MSDTDAPESADPSLLEPFRHTTRQLVRGAAALGICGHETAESVVEDALRAFFREYDTARDASAVQQYLAEEIPRHRVGELTGRCGARLDATIGEYPATVEWAEMESGDAKSGESAGVVVEGADVDDSPGADAHEEADSETDADPILAAVAESDPGHRTLVRGAARAGIGGLDEDVDVLRAALRWYFQTHDAVRRAATARQYALGTMTTGFASDMADVQKGPEVEELLWSHGVRPRVGPEPSEAAEREERVILSKLFDGIAAPDRGADADDAN
ncbi:hypothetical protein [Salinirubrum litoreum]|uniref:Uncharacterized protein n=1 Tax=Salinirubrum litoreum TaxID=1126234 RepID=A0ABD5RBJ9_9EURY|nr:hypothetical protein [Salinirubrum litoreum]